MKERTKGEGQQPTTKEVESRGSPGGLLSKEGKVVGMEIEGANDLFS